MKQTKIKTQQTNEDSILRIQLNAPKANIIDRDMLAEIRAVLVGVATNKNLKLIVFESEGPHFSFGASVAEHQKDQVATMLQDFHGLFYQLMDLAVPTMALVRGQCLGGGLELAAFCNVVYADSTAAFAVPEIKLGVFPPLAAAILPRKIGQGRADHLILTGCTISANEAESIALIDSVFAPENLNEAVELFIQKNILDKSASSLRYALRASRWEFNTALRNQLEGLEDFYLSQLMESHDANEGIASFLEKREARWTHD